MGASHRSPLARSTGSIPQCIYLLAAAEPLGKQGVWLDVWRKFLSMLDEKEALDRQEAFIDGSFRPGEKKGPAVGPTKRGKGTKWMVVVDGQGIPLGSTLAEETLETVKVPRNGRSRPKKAPVAIDCG